MTQNTKSELLEKMPRPRPRFLRCGRRLLPERGGTPRAVFASGSRALNVFADLGDEQSPLWAVFRLAFREIPVRICAPYYGC